MAEKRKKRLIYVRDETIFNRRVHMGMKSPCAHEKTSILIRYGGFFAIAFLLFLHR